MDEDWEHAPLAGQPMGADELIDEMALLALPDECVVVTIEEARKSLLEVKKLLSCLQSIQDLANDLTTELEYLVGVLPPFHEHVTEYADQLGNLVTEWQETSEKIVSTGAVIAGYDPGYIEWYGVVDGHLVLYSWCEGEEDIEWWHPLDSGIDGRRPLVEA